jgi:hypothetical protein
MIYGGGVGWSAGCSLGSTVILRICVDRDFELADRLLGSGVNVM